MDAVNQQTVDQYFSLLGAQPGWQAIAIYNVDESGVPLDPKPPNIITKKGLKKVRYQVSGRKGQVQLLAEQMPLDRLFRPLLFSMHAISTPHGQKESFQEPMMGNLWSLFLLLIQHLFSMVASHLKCQILGSSQIQHLLSETLDSGKSISPISKYLVLLTSSTPLVPLLNPRISVYNNYTNSIFQGQQLLHGPFKESPHILAIKSAWWHHLTNHLLIQDSCGITHHWPWQQDGPKTLPRARLLTSAECLAQFEEKECPKLATEEKEQRKKEQDDRRAMREQEQNEKWKKEGRRKNNESKGFGREVKKAAEKMTRNAAETTRKTAEKTTRKTAEMTRRRQPRRQRRLPGRQQRWPGEDNQEGSGDEQEDSREDNQEGSRDDQEGSRDDQEDSREDNQEGSRDDQEGSWDDQEDSRDDQEGSGEDNQEDSRRQTPHLALEKKQPQAVNEVMNQSQRNDARQILI